jgi:hypothetical protein
LLDTLDVTPVLFELVNFMDVICSCLSLSGLAGVCPVEFDGCNGLLEVEADVLLAAAWLA